MNKEKVFIIIYSFILITELISTSFSIPEMVHFIAKPLLVISLIIFFINHDHENTTIKKFVTTALLFSLLGDVLLMFVEIKSSLFIFGLIAFLIAHIMYTLAFSREKNKKLKWLPILSILSVYGIFFFILLSNSLGNLLIPVSIYIIVILTMVLFAYLRKGRVIRKSFLLVFLGALLFLSSDSLLAINKFHTPLAFPNIWIMTTYAYAQLLIVIGVTKSKTL